jgi:hypothetical protein
MDYPENQYILKGDGIGSIKISDDVVKVIAGLAAVEVEGVTAMSGGIAGGIAERLGRKNLSKGVKADVGEKEALIDLFYHPSCKDEPSFRWWSFYQLHSRLPPKQPLGTASIH